MAEREAVSVLATEGVCRSLQVIPAFVRAGECALCLDETSCVCVRVWLELKGHSRGAMVLGLHRP